MANIDLVVGFAQRWQDDFEIQTKKGLSGLGDGFILWFWWNVLVFRLEQGYDNYELLLSGTGIKDFRISRIFVFEKFEVINTWKSIVFYRKGRKGGRKVHKGDMSFESMKWKGWVFD